MTHGVPEEELLQNLMAKDRELGVLAEDQADAYRKSLGGSKIPYVFPSYEGSRATYDFAFPRSVWKWCIHSPLFSPVRRRWHRLLLSRRGQVDPQA